MKSLIVNALITTATVLVTCWVISKVFPNLVIPTLAGSMPDFQVKNPLA